jgi:hypothetical protein
MNYLMSNDKIATAYQVPVKNHSAVFAFNQWCANQETKNHIAWTGVSLIVTAAVLFPLTMSFILLNGASFILIIAAMISLVLVSVVNLAAMPTRYTIPIFLTGILIDIVVIAASIFY